MVTELLTAIDNMIASGRSESALYDIEALLIIAKQNDDELLIKECESRKSKIRFPYKHMPYVTSGAADPNNNSKPIIITYAEKGRPKAKNFEDYLKPGAPEGLMTVLIEMLEGKRGKDAARIIIAITGIYIFDPPTESVCNRFPSVKPSAFNDAKNKHYGLSSYTDKAKPFKDEELKSILMEINNRLQEQEK